MNILNCFKKENPKNINYEYVNNEPCEIKAPVSYLLTSFDFDCSDIHLEFKNLSNEECLSASTDFSKDCFNIHQLNVEDDSLLMNIDVYGNHWKHSFGAKIKIDESINPLQLDKALYEFRVISNGYKLLSLDQYNKIKSYIEANVDLKEQVKIAVEEWGYNHIESSRSTVRFNIPISGDVTKMYIGSSLRVEVLIYENGGRSKVLRYPYEMKDSKIIMNRIAPLLTELGYGGEAMNRDIDEIIEGL